MNEQHSIRSAWNVNQMIIRGPLTDRKIAQYQKRGFYSADFREQRKKIQDRKASRFAKRDGNFLVDKGGALIYSPR